MDKDTAINRILRDMKLQDLISIDTEGEVRSGEARKFLNMLYMAAWEERGRELSAHHEKKVFKMDKYGNQIGEYSSVIKAAIENRVGATGIYSAIERRSKTRQGYYWKYADNGDDKHQ